MDFLLARALIHSFDFVRCVLRHIFIWCLLCTDAICIAAALLLNLLQVLPVFAGVMKFFTFQESAVFCCIFLSTAGLQLFGGGVKIGWFEGFLWLDCYLSLDVLFYFCTYFCLASSQLFLVDDFPPVIGPAVAHWSNH